LAFLGRTGSKEVRQNGLRLLSRSHRFLFSPAGCGIALDFHSLVRGNVHIDFVADSGFYLFAHDFALVHRRSALVRWALDVLAHRGHRPGSHHRCIACSYQSTPLGIGIAGVENPERNRRAAALGVGLFISFPVTLLAVASFFQTLQQG